MVVDANLFADTAACDRDLAQWRHRMASMAAVMYTFSVRQVILCITKMDEVEFSQAVFQRAAAEAVRRRSSPPPLTYGYGTSVAPAPTSLPAQTAPTAQFTDQQQTQPEISHHTKDEARG